MPKKLINKVILILLCFFPIAEILAQIVDANKIKGITMVAPPKEFVSNPMEPITDVNASWVAIVPYGYTRRNQSEVLYNIEWQWWGEKEEGVLASIRKAHAEGLKVMLKPQVWMPGTWVGEMDFKTEEEWEKWEKDYRSFFEFYLKIAIQENVEMFCLGTEYKIAIQKRTDFWLQLIEEARCNYSGLITYSSNWDAYQEVPFWSELDFIGISAYFPLSDQKTPGVNHLKKQWEPIKKQIAKYSQQKNIAVLFTEYGYLTVDGCAHKAWELEKNIHQLNINEKAQSNAYHALYDSFWNEDFWAGGFLWKWFPEGEGHEGYPLKDYTPQKKLAEKTVSFWYGKP